MDTWSVQRDSDYESWRQEHVVDNRFIVPCGPVVYGAWKGVQTVVNSFLQDLIRNSKLL
jgi:hypothetical protein